MKKSVVLLIGLVYIISVVVVGVIGIKMHIYNETIYVTDIECSIRGLEPTSGKGNYSGTDYDYYYFIDNCEPNVTFEVHSDAKPSNATNGHVRYYINENNNVSLQTSEENNIAFLTFKDDAFIFVRISPTDGGGCKDKVIFLGVMLKTKE